MKRRQFFGLLGVAAPLACNAQQRTRMPVILWVSTEAQPDPFIEGFREGMKEHGYDEGRNLAFILRYAPANPAGVQAMLPELLAIPADLIVSSGPAILAMKAATEKPVLFAISGDPVALGIAKTLARPGRNFTGTTFMSLELAQKRVQLLKELLPDLRTLAILSNKNHPGEQAEHDVTDAASDALGIRKAYVPFTSPSDLEAGLVRVRATNSDAMLVFPDGITMVHRAKIAEFAKANRLPSMFGWREYCEAGGLASYGANQRSAYVRLAAYADRLLRGERPEVLPVEQPTKLELVINLKTATALDLKLPPSVLARADEVIE
jgi:putative tryptophan/tyrosine transport system substrate-binding protein